MKKARKAKSDLFSPNLLPTESLYLRDALEEEGWSIDWKEKQVGPHSYRFDLGSIVVRYASRMELSALPRPIYYLVDDDLPAIVRDPNLPKDYRDRMSTFVSESWPAIVEAASEIVVTSKSLKDSYEKLGCAVTCVSPYWREIESPFSRVPSNGTLEVAWLASRSHAADLEYVIDETSEALRSIRDVRFTTIAGKHASPSLSALPGLANINPMPWSEYRTWLRGQRFDICVHPLRETEVNRGRSLSKWLEITSTRAVPLVSRIPPFTTELGDAAAPFLVEKGAWKNTLISLAEDPDRRLLHAETAHRMAQEVNRRARATQVCFWKEKLTPPDT